MPICSYIVYPLENKSGEMESEFRLIQQCELTKSENHELYILTTDTCDEQDEKVLQEKLKSLNNVKCLSLVYSHSEENQVGECVGHE